jgi:hypothetical protein
MGVDTSSGMGEAEVGDDDNDGMKNWEEYIAGTHPTNAASKFIIVSQIISNGKPQISWLGTAISPYTIESSTNLIETNWVNEALSSATGSGTNMWEPATSPTNSVKFYRVQIK